MINNSLMDGMEIPFDQRYWDSGLGPITEEIREELELTEVDTTVDLYGALGIYKDRQGNIWEIHQDIDKKYRLYRGEK